jgi:dsRNA-specific ribonuclease
MRGLMMKEELFAELLESVRPGAAILRGGAEPARTFTVDIHKPRQQEEAQQKQNDKR